MLTVTTLNDKMLRNSKQLFVFGRVAKTPYLVQPYFQHVPFQAIKNTDADIKTNKKCTELMLKTTHKLT